MSKIRYLFALCSVLLIPMNAEASVASRKKVTDALDPLVRQYRKCAVNEMVAQLRRKAGVDTSKICILELGKYEQKLKQLGIPKGPAAQARTRLRLATQKALGEYLLGLAVADHLDKGTSVDVLK